MSNSDDAKPTVMLVGKKEPHQADDAATKSETESAHKRKHKRELTKRQTEPLELSLKIALSETEKTTLSDLLWSHANTVCTQMESYAHIDDDTETIMSTKHMPAPTQPALIMWRRIRNGMQMRFLRPRHLMAFAHNLGSSTLEGVQDSWLSLMKIAALRLAADAAEQPELALAAKFQLLATVAEHLTNVQIDRRHEGRIWKLYRATLYDLSSSACSVLGDLTSGFWTKSCYCWLEEAVTAYIQDLMPDDSFLRKAAEQFSAFSVHQQTRVALENSQCALMEENSTSAQATLPMPEKADQYMRVLESLDLALFTENKRSEYVQRYMALTTYLPLRMLPPLDELKERLEALKTEMPNFASVIQTLIGGFSLQARSTRPPVLHLKPMLIVGPPAVGKTRFVKKLAAALGAEWGMITPAGDADNRNFAGTARGFNSCHPSWAVEQIEKLKCANPILVVDEIEKAGGSSSNGILEHSLLSFLETESAKIYNDPFLGGPMDLSAISWILMANSVEGLSEPLRSRLHIVKVGPPGPEMFDTIFQNILTEISERLGIEEKLLPELPFEYVAWLKTEYAKAPDIRRLKTATERLLNAAARLEDDTYYNQVH